MLAADDSVDAQAAGAGRGRHDALVLLGRLRGARRCHHRVPLCSCEVRVFKIVRRSRSARS